MVRRAGRHSSAEVSAALFPRGAGAPRSLQALKAGHLPLGSFDRALARLEGAERV